MISLFVDTLFADYMKDGLLVSTGIPSRQQQQGQATATAKTAEACMGSKRYCKQGMNRSDEK